MVGWQVWLLPVIWIVVGGGALMGLIVPPIHHTLQQRRQRRGETPQARAARRRRDGVVALALLIVVLSYTGLHALAATHADRLMVTVRTQPTVLDTAQTVICSSTLTGAGPVEAAQTAINDTPTLPLGVNVSCELGILQPLHTYDFSFSWHDILVEPAHVDSGGCSLWQLRTLGLPNLLSHLDAAHSTAFRTLHRLTGMPIPKSWDSPYP